MSIMELYMKELLMQQKLGHELQQIQQQQQKAPFSYNSQQQFLQTPSSAFSRPVKQQQQPTMFSPKSTFLQQCPPPAMFDPLAAAVAANFMQQSPFANTFGMGQQQQQGMYGMGMGSQQQMQMMAASPYFGFGGFPFPDFTQSPSFALNSTGSCASLDSFPSSGLPSSPDSSSCSSTLNGPFPLAGRPQQFQRANAPTDFSEFAAGGMNNRKRAFNAAGNGTNGNLAAMARQNGSQPQQRPQHSEMTFPMAKQPLPNAMNTKNGKKPSVDSAKANTTALRSTRPNATSVTADSAQEPPKKMSRKLGTTIFVPLEMATVGKVRKPSVTTQPAKNSSSMRDEKTKTSSIPRTTTSQSASTITTTLEDVEAMLAETMTAKLAIPEAKCVEMAKKIGSEEEKPLEPKKLCKNETNLSVEDVKKQKLAQQEIMSEQNQKDSFLVADGSKKKPSESLQQKIIKTKAPLTTTALNLTIKCEPLEKQELQEQAVFEALPPEDAFLLPDEPPTLTPVEKENAGHKKALKKKKKKLVKKGEQEKRKKSGKMLKEKKVERRGRKKKVVLQPMKKKEVKEERKCEKLEKEKTSTESTSSLTAPENKNCQIPPEIEHQCPATEEEATKEEELNTSLEEDDDDEELNDEEAEKLEADDTANASSSQNPFFCRWTKCRERFADDDLLFDHLASAHIEPLKKWVLAEQRELEQQKKTGLKRRRSNGGDKAVKERFRCRWTKCEQFPRRGDAQKKFDWLLKHLVIRHAPKARPFSCIFAGCPLRFPKLQALNDHLRSAHDDNTGRGNGRKSGGHGGEETKKISCFEFRPCVRLPIVRDCIDARTVEWVRRRMDMATTEADEQLATPTSSCSSSNSSTHGEQLALELCRTLEFDEKNVEIKVEKRESIVAAGTEAPRMQLHETIGHLKALFSHKHKVKVPLRGKR